MGELQSVRSTVSRRTLSYGPGGVSDLCCQCHTSGGEQGEGDGCTAQEHPHV